MNKEGLTNRDRVCGIVTSADMELSMGKQNLHAELGLLTSHALTSHAVQRLVPQMATNFMTREIVRNVVESENREDQHQEKRRHEHLEDVNKRLASERYPIFTSSHNDQLNSATAFHTSVDSDQASSDSPTGSPADKTVFFCPHRNVLRSPSELKIGPECSQCLYSSSLACSLSANIESHMKEKPCVCANCSYTSIDNNEHRDPVVKSKCEHTGQGLMEKPFSCAKCSYRGSQKSYLKSHMKIHNKEKAHSCPHCPYTSVQSSDMKKHICIHSGIRPYACSQCSYTASQSSDLKKHLRVHSGEKPYKCSQCNYCAAQSSDIKKHMSVHSGERPYHCPECSYSAAQSSDLKKHMNIHSGKKPYPCPNCSYAASQSSDIKKHMRIHSGEKPYSCPQCAYSASQSSDVKKHMKTHSNDLMTEPQVIVKY